MRKKGSRFVKNRWTSRRGFVLPEDLVVEPPPKRAVPKSFDGDCCAVGASWDWVCGFAFLDAGFLTSLNALILSGFFEQVFLLQQRNVQSTLIVRKVLLQVCVELQQ